MDYADATLVALAEELGSTHVMTADRRDFSVYRLASGAAFDIVP
jgi:predicted nucleic acid-binding protein